MCRDCGSKRTFDLGYFIGQFDNVKALDVLPYHTMGETKYEKLGMTYKLKGVPAMEKDKVVDYSSKKGKRAKEEKKKTVRFGLKKKPSII